jgi:hypothetical protein
MKVFAIASIVKPVSDEQRKEIMPREVPATLKHYLDGKIEQFWSRQDAPGVIFLMNVESAEQAKAELDRLPLVTGGFAKYDFVPVGPLAPLGLLIQGKQAVVEAQS